MISIGETVIYVPRHLKIPNMSKFDFTNPKCEYGTIKSANDTFVFVNYVLNGIPQNTAKATDPNDLYYLDGTSILNSLEEFNSLSLNNKND